MPKSIALDDADLKRGSRKATARSSKERGLMLRLLLHSPLDAAAGTIALAAIVAIIVNALVMQAGRHPSPMFGAQVNKSDGSTTSFSILPRPRPPEATQRRPEFNAAETRIIDPKPIESRQADPKAAEQVSKPASVSHLASPSVLRPPAAIPVSHHDPLGDLIVSSRRIASVQRALTEFGYGQLKPTGSVGSDTRAALQKFERDRKLPVTGQVSDQLVHELGIMTGREID